MQHFSANHLSNYGVTALTNITGLEF